MSQTADPLVHAAQLLRQGDAKAAQTAYEAICRQFPARLDVWTGLAMAAAQNGAFADACLAIERAIGLPGAHPGLWLLAANLYQDAGQTETALGYAQKVPRGHAAYARARHQCGILLADLKRDDAAEQAFREAITADAKQVRAIGNLAAIRLRRGDAAEALQLAREAIRLQPDYLHGQVIVATAAMQCGDETLAIATLDAVLARHPDHVDCLLLRAAIDRQRHAIDHAIARVRRAVELAPDRLDALGQLAALQATAGDISTARGTWDRMLAQRPARLDAALHRTLAMPVVYDDVAAIDAAREQFDRDLAVIEQGIDRFRDLTPEELARQVTAGNFLLAYQGRDDRTLQQRYAGLVAQLLQPVRPQWFLPRPTSDASGRRIRIGFASRFFYDSTAGNYFQSWITDLDRNRFEVFVYCTHTRQDGLTQRIRAAADHFVNCPASEPRLLACGERIVADQLDLLVYPEIGMDPVCATLAAFRLAPVQVAGWGHPVTTGHANIDFFLSCGEMEPADADRHYTETLVRLPGLGTRYAMPVADTSCRQRDRAHYSLPAQRTLYLVPQSLFKIHPDNDALFAAVLAADPDATLVLFAGQAAAARQRFTARLGRTLEAHGLAFADRVLFLADVSRADYLRINQLCDLMLDTLHWSGGNTSLDALASGLPLVTLPGRFMRGRQSMAMLQRLGLPELIAGDTQDYIAIAVALGRDASRRQQCSQLILDRRARLFDDAEPLAALQDFFQRAVARQIA